ncbi:MAG: LytR C-terminal domain-containing protein [Actinomycetota bacterium]|nr:LytR C-terminal domain-containing protein [Acidimicrobiia bacterium]MDQ3385558.1 LytR C-terminal domain-containing protein [Actinomycetota bacterium]
MSEPAPITVRRRRGRALFVVVEVVLLLAVPLLSVVGFRAVLDTTGSRVVDPELDPTEPGYEAVLARTPVALVAGLDPAGGLDWVTVLVLSGAGERGGDVLLVPTGAMIDGVETSPGAAAGPPRTLAEVWAGEGQEGLAVAVATLLAASFSEVVVVDGARVTTLLEPVTPLAVANYGEVVVLGDDGDTSLTTEAGPVTLTAAEVPIYLGGPAPDEPDLARLARHDGFWRAWLSAVAVSDDPGVVPGEVTGGIARYVRGLAAGPVNVQVAPVVLSPTETGEGMAEPEAGPGAGDDVAVPLERFEVDLVALRALANELIPFPGAATPGARVRVRVLDGVGEPGLASAAARAAVRGIGAEITVIGNAARFGVTASRVVWIDESAEPAARRLAEMLGVTDLARVDGPSPFDDVDVTLVVGADLAAAYRSGGEVTVPPLTPDGGDPPG